MKKYIIAFVFASVFLSSLCYSADFSVHGYFRNRVNGSDDLDLQKPGKGATPSNDRFGFIQYNQMRLRLEPNFKLNDNLSIHAQFDVLDNILYGTKDTQQLTTIAPVVGPQTLPPGAGSFYMTGPSTVGPGGAINVRRIWADILTPVGKFRIGRQPSHWGLGIFQNDGNGMQDNFGDTADRILYLLQYDIADAGAITGGLLWDIAYEAQWDPNISGFPEGNPMPANNRDAQQYGVLLKFDRPELTVGTFAGIRRRNGPDGATTMEVKGPLCTTDRSTRTFATDMDCAVPAGIDGDTMLYFADLYGRYEWENYKFSFEGVYVGGKVTTGLALNAIPFKGFTAGQGIIQLPPKQPIQVFMGAFEAEGHYDFGGTWKLQTGYAPGDSTPLSNKITQLGFRPDYQIALLMFYMPLGTSPALYGQKAGSTSTTSQYLAGGQAITSNYINNAFYVSAGYKHKFEFSQDWVKWVKAGTKITTAWAPQKNTNVNFADLVTSTEALPALSETANSMWKRWYGLEVDLSGEAQLFENLYTAVEAGMLIPGREYDIDVGVSQQAAASIIDTIPNDKATLAWMFRVSAILQF